MLAVSDDEPPVPFEFTGPPEPVVDDDGVVQLVHPVEDEFGDRTGLETTALGSLKCARCGTEFTRPIANGEIQMSDAFECPGCERQGPYTHAVLEEHPEISASTFAAPGWPTPSQVDNDDWDGLWRDVREWIHTYWATDEEHLYDGLTAYAISTWLRPNFNFLPQLMVMGKHETGKTQLLQTLKRVAYRSKVPVSFTPAAIFRTIDKYDITLFLSEYHDINPDLRDEVNAVIKGSQKRGEDVMRTEKGPEGGYEPVDFDIFTHVGIGTQFDPPDDIISRCIKIQTNPTDRDIPHKFADNAAEQLRNRLLWTRFRLLESDRWQNAEQAALGWLNDRGISGRLREKLLCLVTVAEIYGERDAIEPFVDAQEAEAEEASSESDDALVIQAILDLALKEVDAVQTLGDADPWEGLDIPISDVRDTFEDMTGREVKPGYIGQIRKRLGLEKHRGRDGVAIRDPDLEAKLQDLVEENNLDWGRLDVHERIRELDESYRSTCSECGETATLTHRDVEEGHHMCGGCAAELEEAFDDDAA